MFFNSDSFFFFSRRTIWALVGQQSKFIDQKIVFYRCVSAGGAAVKIYIVVCKLNVIISCNVYYLKMVLNYIILLSLNDIFPVYIRFHICDDILFCEIVIKCLFNQNFPLFSWL